MVEINNQRKAFPICWRGRGIDNDYRIHKIMVMTSL